MKTDQLEEVLFDRGFQVLLTAYPEARKHLDFEELDLYRFNPGALIFAQGTMQRIGDPIRDASTLWATRLASIGSIGDKWKIYRLSSTLKRKSLQDIFEGEEQSTLSYLKDFGFSDRIIKAFFKPFFAGIFLEEELRTSSRMFEFTFKMFSEGYAAIPASGIEAIPRNLANSLKQTTIQYNRRVRRVGSDTIVMEGGEVINTDATLVTVPIDPETGELNTRKLPWKRCDNLYFAVEDHTFPEGIIGLVADKASLVNNLYYPFGQFYKGDPVLS
ncbi:MAG: FAD-dependent oxidoreductase, partial [Robiginitalea sp.]